jgi:hypothetical protein
MHSGLNLVLTVSYCRYLPLESTAPTAEGSRLDVPASAVRCYELRDEMNLRIRTSRRTGFGSVFKEGPFVALQLGHAMRGTDGDMKHRGEVSDGPGMHLFGIPNT